MQSQERTHQCPRVSRGTRCKCHFSRVCELKSADRKTFKSLSCRLSSPGCCQKVSSRLAFCHSLQFEEGQKTPKDDSAHQTNVETSVAWRGIRTAEVIQSEVGNVSELSNFSVCQRDGGGRALASVFSSDCFSATHQAALTAPSGTVNLSLWEIQKRWKPTKTGHLRLTCAALTHGKHILVPCGKKKSLKGGSKRQELHPESPATAGKSQVVWVVCRSQRQVQRSHVSIYPPSVPIHVSQEGHAGGKQGFFCIHLFRHVAQVLVASQRTHTHTQAKSLSYLFLFFMTFNSQM